MVIFLLLFVAILSVLAIFGYGVYGLLFYALFAADRDGYAFLNFISTYIPDYKLVTRGAFIALYLYCSFVFVKNINGFSFKTKFYAAIVQVLSAYILFVCVIKNYNIEESLSFLVYSGLPVFIIWIVCCRNRENSNLYIYYVAAQMLISFAVLMFPELKMLDGGTYKMAEGVFVFQHSGLNFGIPGLSDITKDHINRYAQFHNPNALGLYSTVSIACGIYVLFYRRYLLGAILFALGLLGWLNSLTRGPLLFLFIGLVGCGSYVLMLNHRVKFKASRVVFVIVLAFLALILLVANGLIDGIANYLVPSSGNISISGRFAGYENGLSAIANYPILGVVRDYDWSTGYPHFLPLDFSVNYGVISGFLISIIVFFAGLVVILFSLKCIKNRSPERGDYLFSIILVMVAWGGALTNNIIAPVLFWISLAESFLITFERSRDKKNL